VRGQDSSDVDERAPQRHGARPVRFEQEAHREPLVGRQRRRNRGGLAVEREGLSSHLDVTLPAKPTDLHACQRIGDGDQNVARRGIRHHEVDGVALRPVAGAGRSQGPVQGVADEVHHGQTRRRCLGVLEHSEGPALGRWVLSVAKGDPEHTEGSGIRLGDDDVDSSRHPDRIGSQSPGVLRHAGQGGRQRRHAARRCGYRDRSGSVDQPDEPRPLLRGNAELDQAGNRFRGSTHLCAAVGEHGAGRTGGGVVRRLQVGHPPRQFVVGDDGVSPAVQDLLPFPDPVNHLRPVVIKALDDSLGLEVGVPGDRERTPRMHRHPHRNLAPGLRRGSTEGDLEKPLEHALVIDPRPNTLIVLRITHDEPRTDGPTVAGGLRSIGPQPMPWRNDGEVGLDRGRTGDVLHPDERDSEIGDHRRHPFVH
jgi:hypothetical protein